MPAIFPSAIQNIAEFTGDSPNKLTQYFEKNPDRCQELLGTEINYLPILIKTLKAANTSTRLVALNNLSGEKIDRSEEVAIALVAVLQEMAIDDTTAAAFGLSLVTLAEIVDRWRNTVQFFCVETPDEDDTDT
jgi:hypothetical protein